MLNNIRVGKLTKSTYELLNSRVIPFENKENIIPTKILPYRTTVQQINEREHNLLPDNNNKIYGVDIICPTEETYKNMIFLINIYKIKENYY